MSGNLIPLDEAAKMLGKTPDELAELRSNNEIFGYRDGSSWKFKLDEINRFADEQGIELTGEGDDLSSDADLIDDSADEMLLEDENGDIDLASGSDVKESESHVLSGSDTGSDPGGEQSPSDTGKMVQDDELLLAEDDLFGEDEEIGLQQDSDELGLDSDSELSSDFDDDSSMMLEDDDSSEIALDAADSGVNLKPTDSGLSLDEEPLELGGSDIDALELPEDSGISLIEAQDGGSSDPSGLSVQLPEESGLSMLNTDAGGSDPSGVSVELPDESDISLGTGAGASGPSASGSDINLASGLDLELPPESDISLPEGSSAVNVELPEESDINLVQADDEFMLTPVESAGDDDESSGSQVIALEDSEIYADESSEIVPDSAQMDSGLEVAPQPAFEADESGLIDPTATPEPVAVGPSMSIEQPIPVWMVAIQTLCLVFLLCGFIISIDITRNIWETETGGGYTPKLLTDNMVELVGYFSKE